MRVFPNSVKATLCRKRDSWPIYVLMKLKAPSVSENHASSIIITPPKKNKTKQNKKTTKCMQMPSCANKYLKACLSFTSLPPHGHVIGEWAARTLRRTFGNRSAFGLQVGSCESKEAVTSKELFVGVGFGFWVARLFWYWKGNIVKESDVCKNSTRIHKHQLQHNRRERGRENEASITIRIKRLIERLCSHERLRWSLLPGLGRSNCPTTKEMFASRVGFMSLQKWPWNFKMETGCRTIWCSSTVKLLLSLTEISNPCVCKVINFWHDSNRHEISEIWSKCKSNSSDLVGFIIEPLVC